MSIVVTVGLGPSQFKYDVVPVSLPSYLCNRNPIPGKTVFILNQGLGPTHTHLTKIPGPGSDHAHEAAYEDATGFIKHVLMSFLVLMQKHLVVCNTQVYQLKH